MDATSTSAGIERFGYIDALRGIAILAVILVHSSIATHQHGDIYTYAFTGQRGVQLFYMVSAFTLFLTLDSGRREGHPWSNFFIRRFFRIAPLFYLAIVANLLLNGRGEMSIEDVVLGFLFLHGWSPVAINGVAVGGWSIAVEAMFYLLVPFLFTRIRRLSQAIALCLVSALCLGVGSHLLAADNANYFIREYYVFFWFPVEFPIFALGIVAYLAWKQYIRPAASAALLRHPRAISLLLLCVCLVIFFVNIPFNYRRLYFSSLIFLPLILALSIHPWGFLVNRFTRYVGKISFSIYLLHFYMLGVADSIFRRIDTQLVARYLTSKPLGLLVYYLLMLALCIPLCTLTWHWIEQPGIRFGRNWIKRREARAAALTAAQSA